jgi:hypothetical protein
MNLQLGSFECELRQRIGACKSPISGTTPVDRPASADVPAMPGPARARRFTRWPVHFRPELRCDDAPSSTAQMMGVWRMDARAPQRPSTSLGAARADAALPERLARDFGPRPESCPPLQAGLHPGLGPTSLLNDARLDSGPSGADSARVAAHSSALELLPFSPPPAPTVHRQCPPLQPEWE